jgi:hypothetical protein
MIAPIDKVRGEGGHRPCRSDELLARCSRTTQPEESLGPACSASLNRLVRARMLGGMVMVTGDDGPYQILRRTSLLREFFATR